MSALGFKSRVHPLTCMLCCPCTIESSDSPLLWHLLTFWQPAWQLSHSHPHTCKQALVGLKTHAAASHCETRQMLYRLSFSGSVSWYSNLIWMLYLTVCKHMKYLVQVQSYSSNKDTGTTENITYPHTRMVKIQFPIYLVYAAKTQK